MVTSIQTSTSEKIDPVTLGSTLVKEALVVGQLYIEGIHLSQTSYTQMTSVTPVLEYLKRLKQHRNNLHDLLKISSLTDAAVVPTLKKQAQIVINQFNLCSEAAVRPLFNGITSLVIQKIDKNFVSIVKKLNLHRSNPTETTYIIVLLAIKKLQGRVEAIISLAQDNEMPFNPTQKKRIEETIAHIFCISAQIGMISQTPEVALLRNLHSLCTKGSIASTIEIDTLKKEFNAKLDQLPERFRNTMDGWVYALSPNPKGGDSWGKRHRFNDWKRLRDALVQAHASSFEIRLKDKEKISLPTELNQFYKCLYEIAFGPPLIDPVTWVRNELIFLEELIPYAIKKLRQGNWEDSFTFDLNTHRLSKSLTDEHESDNLEFLEKQIAVAESNSTHCKWEGSRKGLKEFIITLLSEEISAKLYAEIALLAKNFTPDSAKWGEEHCVEDLERLKLAVANLKKKSMQL